MCTGGAQFSSAAKSEGLFSGDRTHCNPMLVSTGVRSQSWGWQREALVSELACSFVGAGHSAGSVAGLEASAHSDFESNVHQIGQVAHPFQA